MDELLTLLKRARNWLELHGLNGIDPLRERERINAICQRHWSREPFVAIELDRTIGKLKIRYQTPVLGVGYASTTETLRQVIDDWIVFVESQVDEKTEDNLKKNRGEIVFLNYLKGRLSELKSRDVTLRGVIQEYAEQHCKTRSEIDSEVTRLQQVAQRNKIEWNPEGIDLRTLKQKDKRKKTKDT